MINGNAVGGIVGYGKTFILTDESGNELTGVVVDEEVIFTADPVTDIRKGKVAATDQGVVTGAKEIPAYRTTAGCVTVFPEEDFIIYSLSQNDKYDYTQLQCIVNIFNTNISDSVSTEKVVIDNAVYNVGETIKLSDVVKNANDKSINLNITNNSENIYLIRYFTYKEEQ